MTQVMPEIGSCARCRFAKFAKANNYGDCYRYPPHTARSVQPQIERWGGCGEFQPNAGERIKQERSEHFERQEQA